MAKGQSKIGGSGGRTAESQATGRANTPSNATNQSNNINSKGYVTSGYTGGKKVASEANWSDINRNNMSFTSESGLKYSTERIRVSNGQQSTELYAEQVSVNGRKYAVVPQVERVTIVDVETNASIAQQKADVSKLTVGQMDTAVQKTAAWFEKKIQADPNLISDLKRRTGAK